METAKPRKNSGGIYHFSVAGFLITLVVLLVAAPVLKNIDSGDFIESILLTLALVSAVLAVGRRRWVLLVAVILVAPAIAGKWLYHFWPDHILPDIYLISSLVFVIFIILQFLRFIFRAPVVDSEVLCAGVATYLLLGLLWADAYLLAAYRSPGSFVFTVGPESTHVMQGFTSLYFSFITLSTVAYGDIMPASDITRMLSAAEGVTGILFVAVLISRLVSMHTSQALQKHTSEAKAEKPPH